MNCTDIVLYDFFLGGERFTVEDYGDEGDFALYCEDSLVTPLGKNPGKNEAYAAARDYMSACRW